METKKENILALERDFCNLVKDRGIKAGFLHYAADDAVLNRDNRIIKGKNSIESYFNEQDLENIVLDWKPDYVDISEAGDMAYTYGSYTITSLNKAGEPQINKGIFHTVWKRQSDGLWKFVYD